MNSNSIPDELIDQAIAALVHGEFRIIIHVKMSFMQV
jgi:hypothetical protein